MNPIAKEKASEAAARNVRIPVDRAHLDGELNLPKGSAGVVLFAHGSGNGTLLFDLLTPAEEVQDNVTAALRFDIGLLADRLVAATRWLESQADFQHLGIGYFGSSTGGAAALVGAAALGNKIDAVVSRGGRPDLAGPVLDRVHAPTLLIVGEYDDVVIRLNEEAFAKLRCKKELKIVPRATHLFEEEGALEEVARLAAAWFQRHLHSRRLQP
jgi:dienelactone hydrolase